MRDWRFNKYNWPLITIIFLGFGLRILLLDHQSLWYDEAKTVYRTVISLPELFADILEARDQIPFYYLIMRLWVGLVGQTEFAVRFFSVICGVVTLPVIYKTGALVGGKKLGLIAAFLLAISPFHIWYSQEARMYSFIQLCVLLANFFIFLLFRKHSWRNWLGYITAMLIAIYSHMLVLLIMVAHYVFFTLHYRFLKPLTVRWIVSAVLLGLMFGIWGVVKMFNGGFDETVPVWIESAHWYEPFLTLIGFSVGRTVNIKNPLTLIVPIIFLLLLIGSMASVRSAGSELKIDRKGRLSVFMTRLLFIWLLVPVFLTLLVSLNWPLNPNISIYTDRYLSIVLPAFIILVSLGMIKFLNRFDDGRILPIVLVVIVIFTVPGLWNLYNNPSYSRDDWRSAVAVLQDELDSSDVLWTRFDHQTPLSYYIEKDRISSNWFLIPLIEETNPAYETEMRQLLIDGADGAKRIWIITQYYNNDLHGFPATRNEQVEQAKTLDPQLAWLVANYPLVESRHFPGIQMNLFDISD